MKKENSTPRDDELRPEYDETTLTGGVRGKYTQRYRAGTNLVRLDPDVAAAFANDEAVLFPDRKEDLKGWLGKGPQAFFHLFAFGGGVHCQSLVNGISGQRDGLPVLCLDPDLGQIVLGIGLPNHSVPRHFLSKQRRRSSTS